MGIPQLAGSHLIGGIRVALSVIGVAYALLGLVMVLFAVILHQRGDIGTAYLAVGILGWGGTIAATGLSAGSVLGTLALVRDPDTRRPLYVLAILSGWIGALVLGWLAWEFWTHSSLPRWPPNKRIQQAGASVQRNVR